MYAPRHRGKEGENNRGCGSWCRGAGPWGMLKNNCAAWLVLLPACCVAKKGYISWICASFCALQPAKIPAPYGSIISERCLISPRHLAQFVLRYWVHGGCAMCVGLGPLWTTGGFPVPLPPGDPFGFPPPRDMPSFGNASATDPNRSVATDIADTIANFLFISRLLH